MSDDATVTRRGALAAVGGGLVGATGLAGVAGAADDDASDSSTVKCLKYDTQTYQTCPPGSSPDGPVVSAGSKAYPVCTDPYGNVQAYLVFETTYDFSVEEARRAVESDAIGEYGYVFEYAVTDC